MYLDLAMKAPPTHRVPYASDDRTHSFDVLLEVPYVFTIKVGGCARLDALASPYLGPIWPLSSPYHLSGPHLGPI